jgi:hypothetical protein
MAIPAMAPPEGAELPPGSGSAAGLVAIGDGCIAVVVVGCTVEPGGAVLDGVTNAVVAPGASVEEVALLVVMKKSSSPYPTFPL